MHHLTGFFYSNAFDVWKEITSSNDTHGQKLVLQNLEIKKVKKLLICNNVSYMYSLYDQQYRIFQMDPSTVSGQNTSSKGKFKAWNLHRQILCGNFSFFL